MKRVLLGILSVVFALSMFGCGPTDKPDTPDDSGNPGNKQPQIDMTQFPNYIEPDKAEYTFDFEQMVTPYFKGNVIYNETVLLTKENDVISGKLQYAPVKILSVRDYTWKNEYPATAYTVSGNTITATSDTALPYLLPQNFHGQDIPAPYRQVTTITNVLTDWAPMGATIYTESPLLYSNQIQVSYVYDVKDVKVNEFAKYETSGFPKLKAKLSGGQDVKLVAIGDSVAEGCSSSKHYNHEPFMDNWVDQVTQALDNKYEGKVTVKNVALGGTKSEWGCAAEQVNKIVAQSPDMVFVHFGINDIGAGNVSAGGYKENIETLITGIQDRLPDCEIMLIKAFPPHPDQYADNKMKGLWNKLDDLSKEIAGVYTLDMYTPGTTLLQSKKYFDVTANGINHVNDYSSRLYTMNILSALIKY